mgnify:FL=1
MTKRASERKYGKGRTAKRLTAFVLAAALCFGLLPMVSPSAEAADWMEPYLEQVVEWGVMRGDASGNLNPDRQITRAEFVTMVNRAFGYTEAGANPFTDVPNNAWYAEDIRIASRAGYFNGTSATTASPNALVTREQAAAMLGRNLRLQGGAGAITSFTDNQQIGAWSRGLVQEAADMGIIQGYKDGTFRPKAKITRGQVACFLVRALGTLVQEPGEQTAGGVYGNLTINTSGVTLRDTVVTGNLYLTGGVGLDDVVLENVTVMGKIVVSGAGTSQKGESSIVLRNVTAGGLEVDSLTGQFISLRSDGLTNIKETTVRTSAYLEDLTEDGLGLQYIRLEGGSGIQLQLAGNIKEVINLTPDSKLAFAQGVANKVTVDERATGTTLNIDSSATVRELNLDTGTTVTGTGDIGVLTVNSDGSVVPMLPDTIIIRPGVTADINHTVMDSTAAAESSEDPRLLAGYPAARNVAPKTADIVFSTNKSGTIYWALTALMDGSVDEETLVNPSAYSAKIIKNGTVKVGTSKTEMTTKLSGLTVDGSYYLSAILEDSRGRRSPVKVTAFTTPDDSVPNFSTGYPYASVTTDGDQQVVQAMVMPTKDCQLYYALLPKGSAAPTAADFKAAAVTGNLGYGVVDVKKNTQYLIPKVNTSYLAEETTYDLYLWLNDADNGRSSSVKKLTVTTLDKTPPVIQHLTVTDVAARSVTLTYSLDEPGTLYWAVVKRGTQFYALGIDDPEELVAKIQVESGTGALKKGSSTASKAATDVRFTVSGLDSQTAYDLYYVAKDRAGNYNVYTAELTPPMQINTLDNESPTVAQEFTHDGTDNPAAPTPYPDTSIRLVFSESVQGIQDVGGQQVTSNFLELYNNVQKASAGSPEKTAAENALADALRTHISLYYKPASGQPEKAAERTADTPSDGDWVIDYRKAIVAMDPSGSGEMIITFPYNTDSGLSGLNLSSGATYYFELQGIADTSAAANRMEGIRGVTKLPEFTTIDAQLIFSQSTAISPDGGTTIFDMTFQLTPATAASVSDETLWDLLFWSESSIEFELYAKDKSGSWEQVGGAGKTAKIQTMPDTPKIGVSIAQQLVGPANNPDFEQLNLMGESREYGIVIKKLNDSADPGEWSEPVSITVVPIAGTQVALREMSQMSLTPERYAEQQAGIYSVKEIGVPTEYTVTHTFRDTTAPTFASGTPLFDPGDEGVNIDVILSRGNTTYYYVVAPLGKIQTVYDGDVINTVDMWKKLPESGLGADGSPVTDQHVTMPSSNDIMNPRYAGLEYKTGYGTYRAGTARISLDGLSADTEYIAYFVLKGEAQDSYSGVYAFRFKTEVVTRPVLTITLMNPSAMIQSDREADVNYMLMVAGKEGEPFNEKLGAYLDQGAVKEYANYWNQNWENLTLLEAMRQSVRTGNRDIGSVFDFFADSVAKDKVTNAVLYSSTTGTTIAANGSVSLTKSNNLTFTNDFTKNMTVGTSYWIVAVGKSPLGSGYAFRSNSYLSAVDGQHPMVTSLTTETPGNQVFESELDAWRHSYRGTVYITFDEDLYLKESVDKWSPVTNKPLPVPPGYVTSKTLLESNNAEVKESTSGRDQCNSLTLSFTRIGPGNSIRLTDAISDSAGNSGAADGTLVLNLEVVKVGNYWTAQFVIAPGSSGWDATRN